MRLRAVAVFVAATVLVVAPLSAEGPDSMGGRRWYVSARCGDDSADGRNRQGAFRTLPRALKALGPGDTLVVMPGEYYHAPLVVEGLPSTPESPIWILAEPRGEAVISAAWEEAAAGCVQWRAEGDGIYSAAHGPVLFGGWKGRFLFRYMSLADLKAARAKTRGWYGEVNGPEYGVVCHDGRVYVKLPGGEDPNGEPIILSPPFWDEPGRTPVVMVRNSPGLIIDGLRVQASGIFGIQFDPISTHAVVRNCVFEYCRAGLGLPS